MKREIKVKSRYSFFKNPIRWFKERKGIKLVEILVNQEWEKRLKQEMELMAMDVLFHGTAVFDPKTGKRVRPDIFK